MSSPKAHAKSVALVLRLVKFTVNGDSPARGSALNAATTAAGGGLLNVKERVNSSTAIP